MTEKTKKTKKGLKNQRVTMAPRTTAVSRKVSRIQKESRKNNNERQRKTILAPALGGTVPGTGPVGRQPP